MQDDSPTPPGEPSFGAKAAMTAAAVAYPVATAAYFWSDWFRFLKAGGPIQSQAEGLVIRATPGMVTLLTPYRIVIAAVSAGLLAVATKRLWQRVPGARAFSALVLGAIVLPQALWYGELSLDWFDGRHFGSLVAAWVAATVVPAALLLKKGGLRDWQGIRHQGRVLAAATGLGWLSFGAISVLEHLYQFADAGPGVLAALATVPLAALGAVGLWKKRTWGLLASGAAVGAHALMVLGLAGAWYAPSGRGMDDVMSAVAGSPTNAVVWAALPALIFVGLLAPFVVGFVKRMAGSAPPVEPVYETVYAHGASEAALAPRLRFSEPTATDREFEEDDAHAEAFAEQDAVSAPLRRTRTPT